MGRVHGDRQRELLALARAGDRTGYIPPQSTSGPSAILEICCCHGDNRIPRSGEAAILAGHSRASAPQSSSAPTMIAVRGRNPQCDSRFFPRIAIMSNRPSNSSGDAGPASNDPAMTGRERFFPADPDLP
jgi:hypothetical protein